MLMQDSESRTQSKNYEAYETRNVETQVSVRDFRHIFWKTRKTVDVLSSGLPDWAHHLAIQKEASHFFACPRQTKEISRSEMRENLRKLVK